jgi:hypothetical protein
VASGAFPSKYLQLINAIRHFLGKLLGLGGGPRRKLYNLGYRSSLNARKNSGSAG